MTVAIFTLYGLLFGSFLTVVVDRVPRGASIVRPGSACGSCGLRLVARDLVPVFSWLALRGRCRKCHTSIGTEPLVLELSTAALFGVMAHHFGLSWEAVAFCVLMAGLVALSWIDLHTKRLPREITHTIAALGFPLLWVAALVASPPVPGPPSLPWLQVLGGWLLLTRSFSPGQWLLGLLVGAAPSDVAVVAMGAGFLGSFTTFSTWMVEVDGLAMGGRWNAVLFNTVTPLVAGLMLVAAGYAVGTALA